MNHSMEEKDYLNEFPTISEETLEQVLSNLELEKYVFHLYVAGRSPNSIRAIQNITKICEEYLPGNYELEVIDIYQQPDLVEQEQILAIPTLIKKLPPPLQKLIGDLTNKEQVIICLDL